MKKIKNEILAYSIAFGVMSIMQLIALKIVVTPAYSDTAETGSCAEVNCMVSTGKTIINEITFYIYGAIDLWLALFLPLLIMQVIRLFVLDYFDEKTKETVRKITIVGGAIGLLIGILISSLSMLWVPLVLYLPFLLSSYLSFILGPKKI